MLILHNIMDAQKEVWKGLVVVICSHMTEKGGKSRSKYMRYLIESILDGSILPEKIIISYSQVTSNYSIWHRDVESLIPNHSLLKNPLYENMIEILFRGNMQISQMNHLIVTTHQLPETLQYVLLADDDDLISPKLISEYYQKWKELLCPPYFVFECGMTIGEPYDREKNSQISRFNMIKNHAPISSHFVIDEKTENLSTKVDTNYGGTLFSKNVLLYYLRYGITRGCNFSSTTADIFLKNFIANLNYFVEEGDDPLIVIQDPSLQIINVVIPDALYFWRKWRYCNLYVKSRKDMDKVVEGILEHGY
jgi:hypothetical protein